MSEGPAGHPAPSPPEGEPDTVVSGPVRGWPPAPPDTWPAAVPVVQAGGTETPADTSGDPKVPHKVTSDEEPPQRAASDTPSVMDMESLPTWQAAMDACVELKAISQRDVDFVVMAAHIIGYDNTDWRDFVRDANTEGGPEHMIDALKGLKEEGFRARKAMEHFLDALTGIGVIEQSRIRAKEDKRLDLYDRGQAPPPKRRKVKGSSKGGPQILNSLSRLSAALGDDYGADHEVRRELAKALEIAESGESIYGDDTASTVDRIAEIAEGMNRQMIAFNAACIPAKFANVSGGALAKAQGGTIDPVCTPLKRPVAEDPPSSAPKVAPSVVSENKAAHAAPVGGEGNIATASAETAGRGVMQPRVKGGGKPPAARPRHVPAQQTAAAAGVVIFCHEQTQWQTLEEGRCEPMVLIVYRRSGEWTLPWTKVESTDHGEYGAIARAFQAQTGLAPTDLEIAKSARIRPIRNGVRYHAAVYTKPITTVYASIHRHEWGVPSGTKAQWIKKNTLANRQTIPIALLTVVDQCWGNVATDYELFTRAVVKTEAELARRAELGLRTQRFLGSDRIPVPTAPPPPPPPGTPPSDNPAVVDLVHEGQEGSDGRGESPDRANPSPRGSIRRHIEGETTARVPKAPQHPLAVLYGSVRESPHAPSPCPSTFYQGENGGHDLEASSPATPGPKEGRTPVQDSSMGSRPVVPPLQLHTIPRVPDSPADTDPLSLHRPLSKPPPQEEATPLVRRFPSAATPARWQGLNEGLPRAMRAHNGEIKVRNVKMVDVTSVVSQGGEYDAELCQAARVNMLTTRSIGPSDPWVDPEYRTICKPWNQDKGCDAYRCSNLHACDAFVPIMPQSVMDLGFNDRMCESIPIMYAPCGSLSHRRQDHLRFQDALMRPHHRSYEGELWWVMGKPPKILHMHRWAGIADPPDQSGSAGSHGDLND